MTMSPPILMKGAAYVTLGEDPPGYRLELAHGKIHISRGQSFQHARLNGKLTHTLHTYIDQHNLGMILNGIDTFLGDYDVRRPDIVFLTHAQESQISGHGVNVTPELLVEITAPETIETDRHDKFALYARFKVPNYWLVDPQQKTFETYNLQNGEYMLHTSGRDADIISAPPFPALSLSLAPLWAAPTVD